MQRFLRQFIILKSQLSRSKMTESNLQSAQLHSSVRAVEADVLVSEGLVSGKVSIELKNKKWSDHEHILYILFLEHNRAKIKSKLIRRSNSFYKEMADFIGGKTGVQCRSHHQKYETRYKYPHRIIRQEKQKINPDVYNEVWQSLQLKISTPSFTQHSDLQKETRPNLFNSERFLPQQCEACCQTDIQGVDIILVQSEKVPIQYWPNQVPVECYPFNTSFAPWQPYNQMAPYFNGNFF